MHQDCPQDRELEALTEDGLPDSGRERVHAHVQGCESCQRRLAELAEHKRLLARLLELSDVREILRPRARQPPTAAQSAWPKISGFELLREVGAGGMGVVYEATQWRPQRRVAVKVMSGIMAKGGESSIRRLRLFLREAETLARLNHPNIATVYCAGQCEDGEPFIAMELVRGEPLGAFLRRASPGPRAILTLLAKVCRAVQHAHERGVVHRDLKPANIVVDDAGEPRVLDFGLAKILGGDATSVGIAAGTLGYMSPEQSSGDSTRTDARSDIYSLGALAFFCLTGEHPARTEGGLAAAIRAKAAAFPSERGDRASRRWLRAVLERAVAPESDRRYATAAELADDLERCAAGRRPRAAGRARAFPRYALVIALILVASAITVAALRPWKSQPDPGPPVNSPSRPPDAWEITAPLGPGLDSENWEVSRAEAERILAAGPPYARSAGNRLTVYAMILDRKENADEAERILRIVHEQIRPSGNPGAVARARLARVLAAKGRGEEVESLLAGARLIIAEGGEGRWSTNIDAEAAVARARLAAAAGDWAESRRILETAYAAVPPDDRFERPGARALLAWELSLTCRHLNDPASADTWRSRCLVEQRKK